MSDDTLIGNDSVVQAKQSGESESLVKDALCWYDPESTCFVKDEDSSVMPRAAGCACDNCFYGRDKLALEIRRLKALVRAKP